MKASTMQNRNGSVVIVSMILGLSLAAMAGGYIALVTQSMKHTQRTFYLNTAFNLAESGAEYAVWCMKNSWTLPSNAWTGDSTTRTYIGSVGSPIFTDSQGAKGFFKIRVTNADSSNPTVIAEGVVVSTTGSLITKQIRVRLSNGGIGWDGITNKEETALFGGFFGSYSSGEMHASSVTADSIRHEITIASTSLEIGDVSIGSAADINGYVAIAPSGDSSAAADFIDSIQGSIMGPDTAAGQPGVDQQGANLIDTNRIAYDFTQDFPDVTVPAVDGSTVVYTSLPAVNILGLIVVGDPDGVTTERYQLNSDVSIPNGTTLLIIGPVEFDVAQDFTVAGNGALVVLEGDLMVSKKVGSVTYLNEYTGAGEAKLYVKGDISISGNGSFNAPYKPAALQVYGTLTEAEYAAGARQNITIGGNGGLSAAVYAPNAATVMNGGGSSGYFAGAIVSRSTRVNGNGYKVLFDEDLQEITDPSSYTVSGWAELSTAADRYNFGG
ncbi:MAG TPA: hypothetical protein VMM36_13630 [Opitutaceae bacterium]|nr:hypothetical protein [Opitutaceae bacterium]